VGGDFQAKLLQGAVEHKMSETTGLKNLTRFGGSMNEY